MPTAPDASIVIPLFNRADLTVRCLAALEANTPEDRYEVVIVDNASTDATGELLDALEGDVTIVRNERNLGFATACNQGAAAAQGRLLVFLNNDTEVQPGWLEALLGTFAREPGVGGAGARLLFPDGTIQHAGMVVIDRTDAGYLEPVHRHVGEPGDHPPALVADEPLAVTGAVLAVRAEAFAAVGGFDEGYWNCFEDVDLCLKLGTAGWRIAYVPSCVVVHHEAQSGPERRRGIPDGARRFASRWRGRIVPDIVHDGATARPGDASVGPATPDREVVAALWQLTRSGARQRGAPVRFDGTAAELVRRRLQTEEDARALGVAASSPVASDRVSVVVAVPEGTESGAADTVASVLAQTGVDADVIVVAAPGCVLDAAGGATARPVRVVDLPGPPAPSRARATNVGLALAAGDWLVPLVAGDVLAPAELVELLACARATGADAVRSPSGVLLHAARLRAVAWSDTSWKLGLDPADELWQRYEALGLAVVTPDRLPGPVCSGLTARTVCCTPVAAGAGLRRCGG